uniref:Uncharacterized protein n=2 Tax=Viruses TaxID=10239 RepID=A0A8S5RJ20_9VIRU|nr:MAG TPA: hypothetical protein [virus sp. ctML55]DAF44729.1 MAG TPA: hypothetical protein [Podoviridae sp. ct8Lf7]
MSIEESFIVIVSALDVINLCASFIDSCITNAPLL